MIRFECDYAEGAHPRVLELITETNFEQHPGYGTDIYCEKARGIIREMCGAPEAGVHFLVGGTQANTTVIAAALRPYQSVISAVSGHINGHETGAVEAAGHKVIPVESADGKINAEQIEEVYDDYMSDSNREHVTMPAMVYISNPMENGTVYTKKELEKISAACRKKGLFLFMDGARLAYGLTAEGNDMSLKDIAKLCDVFYIGGTKCGALFGEAVVITDKGMDRDFRYSIKQRGGMLAKGRLLGLQFIALLEGGLYFGLAANANRLAMKIKNAVKSKGWEFLYDSDTNQQFPIIPDEKLEKLGKKYTYTFIKKIDKDHTAVRFCTSWATKEEDVAALVKDIETV
ncbi:aminotransferase class I/II-fold pyridoxal phosphate-dependent enzyme [Anaerotignum faecicola]|nr:aminotransferase class I/II-fold pyridoxal phosphate-dependent enzyme [Anaerotignum faecicola]